MNSDDGCSMSDDDTGDRCGLATYQLGMCVGHYLRNRDEQRQRDALGDAPSAVDPSRERNGA